MKPSARLEQATKQARTGADWLPHLAELTALLEETERRGSRGERVAHLAERACEALIVYGRVDTARELAESALRLRWVSRWTSLPLRYHRACALLHQGDIEGGRAELADVLKHCQDTLGPDHVQTNAVHSALYYFYGEPALEERFYRAALAELAAHAPEHADTIQARIGLTAALTDGGRYAEAEAECRNLLADVHRFVGNGSVMSRVKTRLGVVLHAAGRFTDAEEELRAAIDTAGRWGLPYTLNALGMVFIDLRQPRSAEVALRGGLVGSERVYGAMAYVTHAIRISLAWAVIAQDRAGEAVDELRDLVPFMVARSPNEVLTLFARMGLARANENLEEMRDVVRTYLEVLGPDHRDTLDAQFELGHALGYVFGHSEEAASILRSVIEARMRVLPPGHPDTDRARSDLTKLTLEP